MNKQLSKKDDAQIITVVSQANIGAERMSALYYDAQYYSSIDELDSFVLLDNCKNTSSSMIGMSLQELQKLESLLFAGKCNEVHRLINSSLEKIIKNTDASKDHIRELFYTIRYVIHSITTTHPDIYNTITMPIFRGDIPVYQQFNDLKKICNQICDYIQKSMYSQNQELKDKIIEYIKNHFNETNIYPGSVAKTMHVTERYAYKLIKDQTGKSISSYIESLRMDRAMELITSTNETISNIAQECGYQSVNTFYKVFKRYYELSPTQFRDNGMK
jgi:AraC-like DNA-binding protein